jgi:ABC-type sugar transport system substrate-binding protein
VTRSRTRVAAIVLALAVADVSLSCADDQRTIADTAPIRSSKTLGTTHGPNGEPATPTSALELSEDDVAKVRAGHHTAALVWHEPSDFTTAVTAGAREVFEQLGIDVVAETSANFDAAKQKADVETVAAKQPSVLLTLPVDPVVTASAYKSVAESGTKIVLLSSVPEGMRYGRDYVNLVTDDLFQMGKLAADALAAAVGADGTVAYFFHEANHYVTNERDQAFLQTITANYPDLEVVRGRLGDADGQERDIRDAHDGDPGAQPGKRRQPDQHRGRRQASERRQSAGGELTRPGLQQDGDRRHHRERREPGPAGAAHDAHHRQPDETGHRDRRQHGECGRARRHGEDTEGAGDHRAGEHQRPAPGPEPGPAS